MILSFGVTGIDRVYHETAYIAALMVYLIEHKDDHETDAELADFLTARPFFTKVIIDVMVAYKPG